MGNSPAPLQAASCAVVAGFQQLLEMGGSMKKVYAGTSGWAYTTWKPDFILQASVPLSSSTTTPVVSTLWKSTTRFETWQPRNCSRIGLRQLPPASTLPLRRTKYVAVSVMLRRAALVPSHLRLM